jgi:hypothetical protein
MEDTEWQYIFTITILTIFMLFYGGTSYNKNSIAYNINTIANYQYLQTFRGFAINYAKHEKQNGLKPIDNELSVVNAFVPNITNIYFATVMPNKFVEIPKTIGCYVIIYNFQNANGLELLVETNENSTSPMGFFYPLDATMNLTDIYPIWNYGQKPAHLLLFVTKKPFWNEKH